MAQAMGDPSAWLRQDQNMRDTMILQQEAERASADKPKPKRLASPALAAQKRRISEAGWAEMDREGKAGRKKNTRKRVSKR